MVPFLVMCTMEALLSREDILNRLREVLPYLREQYGIERIAVYGSFIKGSQTVESDVDILVHLNKPLGLKFVELAYYLEDLLGRDVDLATFETLQRSMTNPRYRNIATEIQRSLAYV